MRTHITVYHYDAFSTIPNKGNPAGVVLSEELLTEHQMQKIAYNVGFNETVFILKSEVAEVKLKYFTPGHEINLCGHATMASLYCLKTRVLLGDKNQILIETNVGILEINFSMQNLILFIEMNQSPATFQPFNGDVDKLAQSIGLSNHDIDGSIPIVYGSTGTWTLLIPILRLDAFKRMNPSSNEFPQILLDNPRASIHPFCLETEHSDAFMHARHFSSPFSGTIEDPVTGTASGVMGAYYLKYMNREVDHFMLIVEQGQEIGRDGRVIVTAMRSDESINVSITGTAVFVKEMIIQL